MELATFDLLSLAIRIDNSSTDAENYTRVLLAPPCSKVPFYLLIYEELMTMNLTRAITRLSLSVILFAGVGFAADPTEVEKYVRARIEIGEMMTNYFKGGERFGEGQRPSEEKMREMSKDISAKLGTVLSKYGLTVEEYRAHSKRSLQTRRR